MNTQSEILELLAKVNDHSEQMVRLLAKQTEIIESQSKMLSAIRTQTAEQGRTLDVLGRVGLRHELSEARAAIQSRQMSMMETVRSLATGLSVARWGDGEVKLMLQPEFDLMYQRASPELAGELRTLLLNYDSFSTRLLLGMPTFYSTRLWLGILAENWYKLKPILEASNSRWANTHISRPLFFERHGQDAVEAWRDVWNGQRICVVAGRGSKFELLPELFDNVASVIRVDSEPADAFATLAALKRQLAAVEGVDLFLIALGPSGTVLAAHLSSPEGGCRQAIDIGHLASSYLNVFKGGKIPEQLPIQTGPST